MIAQLTFPACHRRGGVERIMVECANFLATRGASVSVLSGEFDADILEKSVSQITVPLSAKNKIIRASQFRSRATSQLQELQQSAKAAGHRSTHASFGVVCPLDGVLWVQAVHAEWLKISQAHRNWKGRLKQKLNPFHPFILRLEKKYYQERQYRKLLALTPRVKQEIIEHYGVPSQDIEILPNGFNATEFNPARRRELRATMRQQLGYTPNDRVLVFVANELERKGFFPLVEALARLKDSSVKLLVVGRVTLDPHRELLAKLGVLNQVFCVGSQGDVGRYYAAADAFVLPTYYEAWGLVIVEALASGLPVVTSRLAGAAIAVQEGRTGWLLEDPHDPLEISKKITAALQPSAVTDTDIAASVDDYRWDRVLLKYEEILEACSN